MVTLEVQNFPTPWGNADNVREWSEDIIEVSTPSHGGFLVNRAFAEAAMPDKYLQRGLDFGPWLAFEEDCMAYAVYATFPFIARECGIEDAETKFNFWVR